MINILNCGKRNEGLMTMAELSIALVETPEDAKISTLAGELKSVIEANIGELSTVETEAFALAVFARLLSAISDDPSTEKVAALKNVVETAFDGICELPVDKLVEVCRLLGGLTEPKADEAVALHEAEEFEDKPAVRYAVDSEVLTYLMGLSDFASRLEHIKQAVAAVQSAEQEVMAAVESAGAYLIPLEVH